MPENLLAPGAVLVLWTLIMLIWVAATRFPAMAKAGIDVKAAPPGGRGADLEPPPASARSGSSSRAAGDPATLRRGCRR